MIPLIFLLLFILTSIIILIGYYLYFTRYFSNLGLFLALLTVTGMAIVWGDVIVSGYPNLETFLYFGVLMFHLFFVMPVYRKHFKEVQRVKK